MKRLVLLLLITAFVTELFQPRASGDTTMSDKLQFVAAVPGEPFEEVNDKLKFAGQAETKTARNLRMKWWREARFGMFIHWGLYAVPAGEYKGQRSTRIGEWIMEWANIPRADYEKFAPQFSRKVRR